MFLRFSEFLFLRFSEFLFLRFSEFLFLRFTRVQFLTVQCCVVARPHFIVLLLLEIWFVSVFDCYKHFFIYLLIHVCRQFLSLKESIYFI